MLAALNMATLRDWYGTEWADLLEMDEIPGKLYRRATMTQSKRARAAGSGPPGSPAAP